MKGKWIDPKICLPYRFNEDGSIKHVLVYTRYRTYDVDYIKIEDNRCIWNEHEIDDVVGWLEIPELEIENKE